MPNNINPFTLFLILILLILSTDSQAGAKLRFLKDFSEQTYRALTAMREGIDAMYDSFQKARSMFAGPSR